MSVTGQAMSHVLFLKGGDHETGARFWAIRAAADMHLDLKLPRHVKPQTSGPLVAMVCNRCGASEPTSTLAQAASFRDRHYYCGEPGAPVSGCPTCGRLAFRWAEMCRHCGSVGLRPKRRRVPITELLGQRCAYTIIRASGEQVGKIECGSLRQAKAASRAMWPHERLEVANYERG